MDVVAEDGSARAHEHRIAWNGVPVRAWVPDALAGQHFDVGIRTARLTEQAAAAVVTAATRSFRFEPTAMLLLRAEGVASSYIEGIRVPLVDVAAAEIGDSQNDTASSVADNLAAVVDALETAGRDLTVDDLHNWHRRLMVQDGLLAPEMIGVFRAAQSWIGGTSPRDAAFVPPPAEFVVPLMEDLVSFVNREDIDPVSQAAIVHAQFETIHPYGDGNGRIGRILIGWILVRRLGVSLPPPVSVFVARDPGGYVAGMTLFRLGQLDVWVDWMATALRHSSDAAAVLMSRSEALVDQWRDRLAGLRDDATAHKIIDLLVEHPVVSSNLVARRLGVSERTARAAFDMLAARSILAPYEREPTSVGRPRLFWVASELIELVHGWTGEGGSSELDG
jgi:Fic family protein